MTGWFQRKSQFQFLFKRKNIIKKYKKLQHTHVSFPFHMIATWEVLVLNKFLNSTFAICPCKKAPTSHFYSSQHVENGREGNHVIQVYSFKDHVLTF